MGNGTHWILETFLMYFDIYIYIKTLRNCLGKLGMLNIFDIFNIKIQHLFTEMHVTFVLEGIVRPNFWSTEEQCISREIRPQRRPVHQTVSRRGRIYFLTKVDGIPGSADI